MNEEYLKGYFETYVKPSRSDVTYDDWVVKIKDNESYKRGMFDSNVKTAKPDATYEDWNGKVFGVKEKGLLETAGEYVGSFNRGISQLVAEPMKMVGALSETVIPETVPVGSFPYDPRMIGLAGKKVEEFVNDVNYVSPEVEQSFGGQVATGLGQVAGILATGGASAAPQIAAQGVVRTAPQLAQATVTGLGKALTSRQGIVVGSQSAVPEYEAARDAGLSPEQALSTLVSNYFVGQSEAVPINRVVSRLDDLIGGKLKSKALGWIKNSAQGGLEEFFQEGIQTYLQNEIAKEGYDPERDPLFGVLESAKVGGVIGFMLPGIAGAIRTADPKIKAKIEEKINKLQAEQTAATVADQELANTSTGDPALDLQQDIEAQKVIDEITQAKDETQNGIQERGTDGEEVVTQGLQGQREEGGQEVNLQEEGNLQVSPNTEFVPSNESTVKGDIRESIRPSSPEVVTNEYKLLKERIRNYARGMREGSQDAKKAFRGIGKELESIVNTQQLPAKAQTRLLKRATAVNYNNPLQVERLFDYADKLVQDAAYVDKVEQAEASQSKLRGLLANLPVEQKGAVKSLIKLDPENVDIDAYNSLLDEVAQAKKPVGKGFAVVPLQKVQDFVDRNAVELEEKIDVVVDEATKDAKEEDKKMILKPLFDVAKNNVSNAKGFTKVQQDVIDGLSKANFDKMSAEDMRRYVKVAENIAQNGSFGGSAEMAARLSAEDVKLEKSYKQMNKFLQSASEQISTFAETLNDIAGWNKGASDLAVRSGFSDMHKQLSQVDRANDDFKSRIDKEVKKLEGKYKGRSIYDAESITTSSVWAELQQRLPDETEQEGFDRAKVNIEKDLETKKQLYPDQYTLEIKDWNTLGKATTLQEAEAIMKKSFPKEYELVEAVKKEFEPIADDTITTSETLFNKTAPKLVNYTPVTTYRAEEQFEEPIEETDILIGRTSAPPKPKQGGSAKNRMLYLPDGFIRDRDFLSNIFTAHKKTLYDTKVAPEVLKVGQFLRSNNARTALGVQNVNSLITLFENQVKSQRGIGAQKNLFQKSAIKVLDGISKLGFTRALGGISTGITQAAPTLANTMINLGGDMGIMFRLGTSLTNKGIRSSVGEIIKQNPIGQRLSKMGGVNIGDDVDVKTKGLIRKNFYDSLRPLKEFGDKVYDGIMASFAYGDAKPAELAWISYYVKALKDQGIDVNGYTTEDFWNNEVNLQDTENRKLATAYAEQMINSNLNPSQSEQFAPILRSNTVAGKAIKGGLFPLVSFKLNQSKRMVKAISRLVSSGGKDVESIKILGSIAAEVAAYTIAAEYIAKPLINRPIEESFRELFDMPDDREEDEEFQDRLFWTNIVQNITPFMLNEMTTNYTMDAFNRLIYTFTDTDEGFEKWKKDNGFVTFDKKGLETFGIFGLGLSAPFQAIDDAAILYDGEEEVVNPYTGDVQVLDYSDNMDLIAFSGIVNLMSTLGINFREIASANSKLRKQATREAKGGGTSTPSPLIQNGFTPPNTLVQPLQPNFETFTPQFQQPIIPR